MTKRRVNTVHEIAWAIFACAIGTSIVVGGAGCASTRQFVPRPDLSAVTKSTVHVEVTRPFAFAGCANPFKVVDTGRPIGQVGPGGSLLWERQAGEMSLVASPTIMSMGDFDAVNMPVEGPSRYTFTVGFPFWYPFSRRAIKHAATSPLTVTKEAVGTPSRPFSDAGTLDSEPIGKPELINYPHRNSTVAILTFDTRAGVSADEVALLADRFAVELGRLGVYNLVSRSKMKEVLELQQYSVTCTSVECAVEAGQLLGVEYMIYGSIGRIGSLFTINVYITNVEKGSVVAGATVDHRGHIEGLLTDGMSRAVNNLLRAVMRTHQNAAN